MKQMKSHCILNLLLSLMVCSVCSCSLFDTPTEADTVSYTFTVYTSLNARTAFPAVSTDSVKGYYAYFSDAGGNIIASCKSATAPLTFTFTKLADSMTLNIYAYTDNASYNVVSDSSGSAAALSAVASATYTIASSTITGSNPSFNATLSPVKTGSGTGSVLLKVSYPLNPKTGQTMKKLSYSLNTSTPVKGECSVASSTTDATTGTVTSTIAIPSVAVGKYLLELTFYDTESDTVFVKQTYVPVNVWQNLATTKWQAADGTMKDTLTFTADDFSTHNAAPAKIQAAYTTDSTAPSSPTYASWYSSLTNQIAQTESDKNTSLTSDTLANNTTYYAETVAAPGNNTALYITLSMKGQSFAVSNTVHHYTAAASGTSLTYTAAEHTETGLESSFTQTSGTLTYAGIVTLYSGTNTIAVTCTASDGTTTAMYTLNILNPYCYVEQANTSASDSYSSDTTYSALTKGAGTSTMPLATIQQAVDDCAYENDVRRKENNSESDMNKYTILITGANTVLSVRYSSAVAIVAPTYPFTLTIQGTTADDCTANGIINGTQTSGHRVLLAAGKSSDIKVNLTMKDLYLKGGYSPVEVVATSSPVGALTGDGACILSSYAATALTNVYVGDSATDTNYTNIGNNLTYGIVAIENSTATLTGCNVNHGFFGTSCGRGALYISKDSTVTLTNTKVKNNNCCGVYLYGSTVTFDTTNVLNTTFTNVLTCNGATEISGNTSGIYANNAKLVLNDTSTVASNKLVTINGDSGCGIIAYKRSLIIMNGSSSVKGNSIYYNTPNTPKLSGAGILLRLDSYLYLNEASSVDSNTIDFPISLRNTYSIDGVLGSGICLFGSSDTTPHLIINGGSVTNNSGACYGGGIYSNYGNITFTKGTVSGNTAINSGGGIFSAESSVLTITGDAVIKDNRLSSGTNGPQLYLNSGTCTFTGKPTIANATGSSFDNAIGIVSGATIGIGAALSQKQATETAYIIKPLDTSNSPSYTNRSILTVPSAYTSTVSLTDDVVSNFALTPQTVTINSTSQELTWKIASTTTSSGIITAGYMYYPILNKTIIDANTWQLAIASMIVKGEYTFTFGNSTNTTVDLTSLTSTDGMDIKDGYSVTAVAGADVTVKLPQSFTPFVVESGGTLNLTTSSDTNFLTLTGNNSVRSTPLISTSGTLNLNTALSIDGYTDYSSTDSSILTGEQTSSAAVVIGSNGKCTMNGATIYNSATNSETSGHCGRAFYLSDSTSSLTISSGSIYNLFANYGAAIYAKNGTVTINDGVIGTESITSGDLSLKAYQDGGAIYMDDGSLNIKGGSFGGNSTNQNIAANGNGGSIYMKSGTITMSGGTLQYSKAVSGGALYMKDGTFTMSGGTIANNTATASGGAVYIADGTFTMSGGTIGDSTKTTYSSTTNYSNLASEGAGIYFAGGTGVIKGNASIVYNTAYVSGGSGNNGGGLYIAKDATVSFEDTATIKYNCTGNGSGIYLDGGTFTATGGTIESNHIIGTGNGQSIYLKDGTVAVSGNTVLNQIYLCTDKYIVISGALTTANTYAALINIQETPTAGIQIVNGKSYTLTSSDIAKIKYNGTGFTIGSDGKLTTP